MKYNSVLFCDVDGVLVVSSTKKDFFMTIFDEDKVELLEYIIENTNADIVISSQRRILGLKKFQEMWNYRGYNGNVVDITPYSEVSRGDDIKLWLDKNDVNSYCILDDLNDDFYIDQFIII